MALLISTHEKGLSQKNKTPTFIERHMLFSLGMRELWKASLRLRHLYIIRSNSFLRMTLTLVHESGNLDLLFLSLVEFRVLVPEVLCRTVLRFVLASKWGLNIIGGAGGHALVNLLFPDGASLLSVAAHLPLGLRVVVR